MVWTGTRTAPSSGCPRGDDQVSAANANKYVRSAWATTRQTVTHWSPRSARWRSTSPTGPGSYINGVGWYQDGAKLLMPTGATIQYLAANANKYVR